MRDSRPEAQGPAHPSMAVGVAAARGAITVPSNTSEDILAATARLLGALLGTNHLEPGRIVSAFFTSTPDLNADFPAHAARRLGWKDVPLLCAQEIAVPGALSRVVRVMLTVAGVPAGARLVPVYLDGAAALRPELAPVEVQATPATPVPAAGLQGNAAAGQSNGRRARRKRRVALIGVGQIGGSIGLALGARGAWWRVAYDLDAGAARAAQAAGAADEVAESLEAACAGADLAVLATPVDTLPALVERAGAALPPGAALLDTGSARAALAPALARAAARGIAAVGGHPIAGNEGCGLASARADLFAGASFVLWPVRGKLPQIVTALVGDLGARSLEVEPGAHDRALARTSHLPYLLACALRELGNDAARAGLSGSGFRDMTRLASSDARMAQAFCRANAGEVADAWLALREALDRRVVALGRDGTPATAKGSWAPSRGRSLGSGWLACAPRGD